MAFMADALGVGLQNTVNNFVASGLDDILKLNDLATPLKKTPSDSALPSELPAHGIPLLMALPCIPISLQVISQNKRSLLSG